MCMFWVFYAAGSYWEKFKTKVFERCIYRFLSTAERSKSEVLKEKSIVRTTLRLPNLTTFFFHYMYYEGEYKHSLLLIIQHHGSKQPEEQK